MLGSLSLDPSAHVFMDLFDMLEETAVMEDPRGWLAGLPMVGQVAVLSHVHASARAPCTRHRGMCHVPMADMDCTGTPCQDWSPLGRQLGVAGPHMPILLAWCSAIAARAVPIVVHENVPQFPVELLHGLLGHAYYIVPIIVDCSDLGFRLIRRTRRYTLMFHKARAVVVHNPADVYELMCARIACTCPATRVQDCWLADGLELMEELSPLCHRRGLPMSSVLHVSHDNTHAHVRGMRLLLTHGELMRLNAYEHRWLQAYGHHACTNPDAVFNLGDNPMSGHCTWSGTSGSLPGLRTGAQKYWVPYLGRWLTCKELLACMGLPVYPSLAITAGVPMVYVKPGRQARHMLGNMMHAASIGAMQMLALSCARPMIPADLALAIAA